MNSKTNTHPIHSFGRHNGLTVVLKTSCAFGATALALCVLLLGAFSARAEQTNTLSYVSATNIFAGAYFNGYAASNSQVRLVITDNSNQPVNISFSAPAGITALLNAPFDTNGFTTNTTFSYTVLVNNLLKGAYPITITATNPAVANSASSVTVNLIADHQWVAASSNDVNWSTAANWSSNSAPGVGDIAIFQDTGALVIGLTNATTTNFYYTNYISSSTTIDGLVYVTSTNSNAKPINTTLASGATLSVLGRRGLIANVDCRNDDSKTLTVNIWGTGASLLVSNANGNFAASSVSGGNSGLIFDMSGLDNFTSVGQRFGVGDGTMVQGGGLSQVGNVAQLIRNFAFARTNLVKVSYVGPISTYDYITNSIMFFNNFDGNNGSQQFANLGITNAFFADSISIALHKAGGNLNLLRFNPAFLSNNPVAYFRGAGGGRMSFLGVGIDSSQVNSTARSRGHLDMTGGTVDMQVNNVWLGHNRTNYSGGNQMIGNISVTKGIIDANTIIAGYKEYVNTNTCQSTINIFGTNSTLVVNTELMLGYTAGDTAPLDNVFTPTTFGQLNVRSNAVARINRINVGLWSTNNQVNVTFGGNLIVSNTIATPTNKLTQLRFDGANLTLLINGIRTNVFVTNLTASLGTVRIASVTGLGTYPTNVPLISYENLISAPATEAVMPPGLYGSVSNNASHKVLYLYVENVPPQDLTWRGNLSGGTWDNALKNWVNTNGVATNFQFGDSVRFDDSASNSTVTLSGSHFPGDVVVSNTTLNFTMTGSGNVAGGALSKQSTGRLTLDTAFGSPLTLSDGAVTLTANGTVNSASISTNGTLTNGGMVIVNVANSGRTVNTGTISNGLSVSSGSVLNSGTTYGSLNLSGNGALTNLVAGVQNPTSINTSSNTILANFGLIHLGGSMNMGGQLIGNGTIDRASGVAVGSAPVFINGDGRMSPGTSIGIITFDSLQLKLDSKSTNIFEVDIGAGTNDVVVCDRLDFGNNTPCYILVSNIGSGSFSAGQTFQLFSIFDPSGPVNASRTNAAIVPTIPGLGMAWDTSNLLTNGVLAIVSAPIPTPTNITYTVSGGVSHLSWPEDYIGWRLQTQTNAITVGIKTNWVDVADSVSTNSVYITNSPSVGVQFFRMIYP